MKRPVLAVGAALMLMGVGVVDASGPRALLQTPAPSPGATPELAPVAGSMIPPFDAEGVDGVTRHIAFPEGTSTVLLFFLSGCPHCHRMIPEWNRAFELRPPNIAVVGILMDREPPGFFDKMPISFPVLRSPGNAFLRSLRVYRAPVTMRVAPGGRVADVEVGEMDLLRLGELFRK